MRAQFPPNVDVSSVTAAVPTMFCGTRLLSPGQLTTIGCANVNVTRSMHCELVLVAELGQGALASGAKLALTTDADGQLNVLLIACVA